MSSRDESTSDEPAIPPLFNEALTTFEEALEKGDVNAVQAAALQALEAAWDSRDSREESPMMIASCLEECGKWHEARQVYEDALAGASFPENIRLMHSLANVQSLIGDITIEVQTLRECLAATEKSGVESLEISAAMSLARCLLGKGNIDEAKKLIERCFDLEKKLPESRQMHAEVLILLARCHIEEREFILASQELTQAWECLEQYDPALFLFGMQASIARYYAALAIYFRRQNMVRQSVKNMEKVIEKSRWVAACPFDFATWSEIRFAKHLCDYATDLKSAGHRSKSWEAAYSSRLLYARYRLDSGGQIPRGVLQKCLVGSLHWINRVASYFQRRNCADGSCQV